MGGGCSKTPDAADSDKLDALYTATVVAQKAYHLAQQALQDEEARIMRGAADTYYRRRTGQVDATTSGWDSPRVRLLDARRGSDAVYKCGIGVMRWNPHRNEYVFNFYLIGVTLKLWIQGSL